MKQIFDTMNGIDVYSYILENDFIKVELLEYGARIVRLIVKDVNIDVVAGFDSIEDYNFPNAYVGCVLGRVCNRMKDGVFTLDDKVYTLAKNEGENTLHGGEFGFDKHMYEAELLDDRVVFTRVSPDMEEGFPGNLKLKISYILLEDGLSCACEYTSDKDTICSISNNMYFNMNGHESKSALDNEILIHANKYNLIDSEKLTLDICEDVKGTPFDFTKYKALGEDIYRNHEQLRNGNGYDHNYQLEGEGIRHVASARGECIEMEVHTTMPCLHLYSVNFLDSKHGKDGIHYAPKSFFNMNTQYCPNAIHYPEQKQPTLLGSQIIKHCTQYKFKVRKKQG